MSATVKVATQVIFQGQATDAYVDAGANILPYTSWGLTQKTAPIEDDSNVGVAFKGTPQRGQVTPAGSTSFNMDWVTILNLLEYVTGFRDPGDAIFYFDEATPNVSKLSFGKLDGVSYRQHANVYIKSLKISGSSGQNIKCDMELVSSSGEVRAARATFPAMASFTYPEKPFTFHEMSGTSGYFRIGDQADVLSASDNLNIEEFSFEIVAGFDLDFASENTPLTPVFGMVPPSVSGSFKIPRHTAETFMDWRDAFTPLQLELNLNKAARNFKLQIPNFTIDANLSDDDIAKQDVEISAGRNGIGTALANEFMDEGKNSPIIITLT